jgi:hypothetical protein
MRGIAHRVGVTVSVTVSVMPVPLVLDPDVRYRIIRPSGKSMKSANQRLKTGKGKEMFANLWSARRTRRASLGLCALVFAALLAVDAAAIPSPVQAAPNNILYNQFDNFGGTTAKSANPPYQWDAYDSWTADDFVVPSGETWHITKIEFEVSLWVAKSTVGAVNVYIYTNLDGAPFLPLPLAVERNVGPSSGSQDPHVVLPLDRAVDLPAGHWWISVQSNVYQNSNEGTWSWLNRTVQSHAAASWENPGGAEGHGCTSWGVRAFCWNLGQPIEWDQVFLLRGTVN